MKLEPIIQSEESQTEKNKYHIITHILESRKMVLMNLFAGQQWRNRHREQTYGHGERGGEGEMYGEGNIDTCYGNLLYVSGNSNRGSVST